MRFIIFVGSSNSLAESEVKNRIPEARLFCPYVYSFEMRDADMAIEVASQMGSSLKLAVALPGAKADPESIAKVITEKKFAIHYLGGQSAPEDYLFKVKENLARGRYIEGKEYFGLSPIILAKQKVNEFFIDNGTKEVFKTIWIHDYQNWIKKDRHMPRINPKAGMLPPKIARSMINLLPFSDFKGKIVVDPFCGSGRILIEAIEMGCEAIGVDISSDQVSDTKENLSFIGSDSKVVVHDATHLSEIISRVDAIVTEPFLGKPNLRADQIKYVAPGLEKLYLGCLKDWVKVLKPGGYVVMVFPIFKGTKSEYKTSKVIDDKHLLGYNQLTRGLVYSRPEADTKREIIVLQKQ